MPISSLSNQGEKKIATPHYDNSSYGLKPAGTVSPNAGTYQGAGTIPPIATPGARQSMSPGNIGFSPVTGNTRPRDTLAQKAGVRMGPSVVNPNPQMNSVQNTAFQQIRGQQNPAAFADIAPALKGGNNAMFSDVAANVSAPGTPQPQQHMNMSMAPQTPQAPQPRMGMQQEQQNPQVENPFTQTASQMAGAPLESVQSAATETDPVIQGMLDTANVINETTANAEKQATDPYGFTEAAYRLNQDGKGDKGYKDSVDLNEVRDVTYENPYSDDIQSTFNQISTDIANQQAHGLSVIEQQKQKAINDLGGALGARGMGSSYATMLSGLNGLEAAAMGEGADLSANLEKQRVDQLLAKAEAMIAAGDVEGGTALKAEIANQAADSQGNATALDQNEQQFEQAQAVQSQIFANIENMKTAMDVENITQEEKDAFDKALTEMAAASASGDYTPEQLLQLYFSLFAQYQKYVKTEEGSVTDAVDDQVG